MSSLTLPAPASVLLSDGRTLGYAEAGDPAGTPMIWFHGTPASRLVFTVADPLPLELGVRIIVPERPGYGLSSPAPRHTLLQIAEDTAALADHLGFERFAVAGGSGGGPPVAACAFLMPERLMGASMLCSAAPLDDPELRRGLSLANRFKFLLPRRVAWILKLDLALAAAAFRRRPQWFVQRIAQSGGRDHKMFADPLWQQRTATMLLEAFRQGSAGTMLDLSLYSRPWGFDLEQIRMPVHIWHGEKDRMAPVAMGRLLAQRIPHSRSRFLPEAGHLVTQEPGVWRDVLTVAAGRCGCADGAEQCSLLSEDGS